MYISLFWSETSIKLIIMPTSCVGCVWSFTTCSLQEVLPDISFFLTINRLPYVSYPFVYTFPLCACYLNSFICTSSDLDTATCFHFWFVIWLHISTWFLIDLWMSMHRVRCSLYMSGRITCSKWKVFWFWFQYPEHLQVCSVKCIILYKNVGVN